MKLIRCLTAVLMMLVGATGSVHAQDVRGYVQEVDATQGSITLAFFIQGKTSVKSFNLLKADIPVTNPAGQALKLSDVQPESLVTLKLNSEEDVVSIIAPLPTLHGSLTDVDAKKSELVLKVLTEPRTIAISPDTKIYADGEPAKLIDLTVGTFTRVTFTQDQKSVLEVRSGRVFGYAQPILRIGVLIDMDAEKRLVRVFTTNMYGDVSALREVPLAKDATISLSFMRRPIRPLKVDEITKGFSMFYWVEPVFKKVVHMEVEMPVLARRTVKALDLEKRRLTILENDVERVLTLSPKVKILGPSGPGKLEAVVPDAIVDCGLSPDRKEIEVLAVPSQSTPRP